MKVWKLFLLLPFTLLVAGCVPVLAPPPPQSGPGIAPSWGMLFGPTGCLMPLITLTVIVLAVALIWGFLRRKGISIESLRTPSAPSAEEIARRRYASGEISRDEYQQLLRDLEESR